MRWLTLSHLTLFAAPLDMISAAAQSGFDSVGVRICPRRPGDEYFVDLLGQPAELKAVRAAALDDGIRIANVSVYQFYPEVSWDHLAPAIDATAELGSKIIVANCFDPDRSRFEDRFYRYCEYAKPAGINIALEFMPYSEVRTLADALEIVDAVPSGNAGLVLDALHLQRSGGTPKEVATIDPAKILFAQLCDAERPAKLLSKSELLEEARTSRLKLGAGNLPLVEFVESLPLNIELEYEVVCREQKTLADVATEARVDLTEFVNSLSQGAEPRGPRGGNSTTPFWT